MHDINGNEKANPQTRRYRQAIGGKKNTMKKSFLNNLFNQSILNYGLSAYIIYLNSKIHTYHVADFKSGYIVSDARYTQKIPLKYYTANDLKHYATKYKDILMHGFSMLGVWINQDVVYLDISIHFTMMHSAIDYLNANKQKAFYDIKRKQSFDAYLNIVE